MGDFLTVAVTELLPFPVWAVLVIAGVFIIVDRLPLLLLRAPLRFAVPLALLLLVMSALWPNGKERCCMLVIQLFGWPYTVLEMSSSLGSLIPADYEAAGLFSLYKSGWELEVAIGGLLLNLLLYYIAAASLIGICRKAPGQPPPDSPTAA